MVSPVSAVISRIAAFLIIFIVCAIGVAVLWWLSDLIINLPIVRQLDTLGGFVFGALNGILIVFVTVSVIGLTSQYLLKDMTYEEKQNIVEGTILYEQFQNINPITSLLGVESETK
ncbi:MAG: CvpA family protein [Clostridia bacterium]|nr:CvpA family protein [Clostridia bacterium]